MSESAIAQLLSAYHSSRDQEKARRQRPCSKYIGTSLSPGSRRSIRPGAIHAFKLRCTSPLLTVDGLCHYPQAVRGSEVPRRGQTH